MFLNLLDLASFVKFLNILDLNKFLTILLALLLPTILSSAPNAFKPNLDDSIVFNIKMSSTTILLESQRKRR